MSGIKGEKGLTYETRSASMGLMPMNWVYAETCCLWGAGSQLMFLPMDSGFAG